MTEFYSAAEVDPVDFDEVVLSWSGGWRDRAAMAEQYRNRYRRRG